MNKNSQNGFSGVIVLLGILSLVVVGAGGLAVYNNSQNKSQNASISTEDEVEILEMLPTDLAGVQPVSIIQEKVALTDGVTIVSVELESEDGVLFYKVKLSDGSVVYFNALTAEVTTKPSDSDDDESEDGSIPSEFVASVSVDAARKIAQDIFPEKVIHKIKLKLEDGVVVYSIRFQGGARVDVSAVDGTVTRQKEQSSQSDNHSSDDSSDDSDSNEHSEQQDEDDDSDDHSSVPTPAGSISQDQARSIALGMRAGTIEKVEKETDNGSMVYSFRYTEGGRVDVRASDGKVVRVEN